MDELDDDDIEKIRQRRLKAMQKAHQAKQEFIQKGHGEYKELPSEKGIRDQLLYLKLWRMVAQIHESLSTKGHLVL